MAQLLPMAQEEPLRNRNQATLEVYSPLSAQTIASNRLRKLNHSCGERRLVGWI